MSKRIGNIEIFNATPHSITFLHNGEVIEVVSDFIINATVQEESIRTSHDGIEYVRTKFSGNEEGERLIRDTYDANDQCVIVGSIIAAQAYPGRVMAMVPAPGFERVPPAEKRMRADKFTTFEGGTWSESERTTLESLLLSYSTTAWEAAWGKADVEHGDALISEVRRILGL